MANNLTANQFGKLMSATVGQLKPGDLDDIQYKLSQRHVTRGPDFNRTLETQVSKAYDPTIAHITSVGFDAGSYAPSGTATITFTFDQAISVSGTPRTLLADTGSALLLAPKTSTTGTTLVCQATIGGSDTGTLTFAGGPNGAFVTVSSYYTFTMNNSGSAPGATGNGWTILVAAQRNAGTKLNSQSLSSSVSGTAITIYLATDSSGNVTTTITQLGTYISGNSTLNALLTYTAIGTGSTVAADMNVTPVTFATGYNAWAELIDLNGGSITTTSSGKNANLNFSQPATMPTIS
jgi:hypothetical protein